MRETLAEARAAVQAAHVSIMRETEAQMSELRRSHTEQVCLCLCLIVCVCICVCVCARALDRPTLVCLHK